MDKARIRRALNQRMFFLGSQKIQLQKYKFEVVGSPPAHKLYHVGFDEQSEDQWTCTCVDAQYHPGQFCKHVFFVLFRVLKFRVADISSTQFSAAQIEALKEKEQTLVRAPSANAELEALVKRKRDTSMDDDESANKRIHVSSSMSSSSSSSFTEPMVRVSRQAAQRARQRIAEVLEDEEKSIMNDGLGLRLDELERLDLKLKKKPLSKREEEFKMVEQRAIDYDKEEECGICYEQLKITEKLSFCYVQCGKSFHLQCFTAWSARRSAQCVYCRADLPEILISSANLKPPVQI
jgi:hypothetical protein